MEIKQLLTICSESRKKIAVLTFSDQYCSYVMIFCFIIVILIGLGESNNRNGDKSFIPISYVISQQPLSTHSYCKQWTFSDSFTLQTVGTFANFWWSIEEKRESDELRYHICIHQ